MLKGEVADRLTLGPMRRRRRTARLLAELDNPDTRRPRRVAAPSSGRTAVVWAATLTFTVFIGSGMVQKYFGVQLTLEGFEQAAPLGRPPDVQAGLGPFAFALHQPGQRDRPVTYDPCRPIEYEVDNSLAPPGAEDLVRQAVSAVSRATGLRFEYVGQTDRAPFAQTAPHREPVLITWTRPSDVTELLGVTAGVGGSTARGDELTGKLEYVTGGVALDAPQLTDILAGPNGAEQVRAVIMHELAHVVGLDHVSDRGELMHPDSSDRLDFGPGDREGLAELGRGRSFG